MSSVDTTVADPAPHTAQSAYAQLSHTIKQAGLLRARPGYYSWKVAATLALFGAGCVGFVHE